LKNINDAESFRDNLLQVIKKLNKIKLVKMYYKKNMTCDKDQIWKSFNVVRDQRLQMVEDATDHIVKEPKSDSKASRDRIRNWRGVVNAQLKAIKVDQKKTEKVIANCNELYELKNNIVWNTIVKKEVKEDDKTFCSKHSIKEVKADLAKKTKELEAVQKKMAGLKSSLFKGTKTSKKQTKTSINLTERKLESLQVKVTHDTKLLSKVTKKCSTTQPVDKACNDTRIRIKTKKILIKRR